MQGLWLEAGKLTWQSDLPMPKVHADEALVRVLKAGICNTDLELMNGYYPYTGILGHEFVGIVVEGPSHLINKRVVGELNSQCGQCQACQQNLTTHCQHRTVLGIKDRHGAFAEYLSLPAKNLLPVPDSVTDAQACFVEPLAAALEIQEQINISAKDKVAVLGCGKLGHLIAQTLLLTGCDLSVFDRNPEKLAFFAKAGTHTFDMQALSTDQFDIIVECTGSPTGLSLAIDSLMPRGKLVLKSTYAGDVTFNMAPIVVKELTVIGSRCGPFKKAIDLLAQTKINTDVLISDSFNLRDGVEAFAQTKLAKQQKIIIEIS